MAALGATSALFDHAVTLNLTEQWVFQPHNLWLRKQMKLFPSNQSTRLCWVFSSCLWGDYHLLGVTRFMPTEQRENKTNRSWANQTTSDRFYIFTFSFTNDRKRNVFVSQERAQKAKKWTRPQLRGLRKAPERIISELQSEIGCIGRKGKDGVYIKTQKRAMKEICFPKIQMLFEQTGILDV